MARELGERTWCNGEAYSLADIAAGCLLGYLDLRHPDVDWRGQYPNLAQARRQARQARVVRRHGSTFVARRICTPPQRVETIRSRSVAAANAKPRIERGFVVTVAASAARDRSRYCGSVDGDPHVAGAALAAVAARVEVDVADVDVVRLPGVSRTPPPGIPTSPNNTFGLMPKPHAIGLLRARRIDGAADAWPVNPAEIARRRRERQHATRLRIDVLDDAHQTLARCSRRVLRHGDAAHQHRARGEAAVLVVSRCPPHGRFDPHDVRVLAAEIGAARRRRASRSRWPAPVRSVPNEFVAAHRVARGADRAGRSLAGRAPLPLQPVQVYDVGDCVQFAVSVSDSAQVGCRRARRERAHRRCRRRVLPGDRACRSARRRPTRSRPGRDTSA